MFGSSWDIATTWRIPEMWPLRFLLNWQMQRCWPSTWKHWLPLWLAKMPSLRTAPTSSVFTVGTDGSVNANTATFVTYLFATSPGISKVGSYTGNGSSQTINCGFTTGARFVLIKRTDSTGDWFVWDTARGIVSANDPHLSLNTTAAEVTTDDSIDPDTSGFIVNQVAATNINVNGATYVFCSFS